MVRVSLGYPSTEQESDMLLDHAERDRVLDLEPVTEVGEIVAAQEAAAAVHGSEALRRYVVSRSWTPPGPIREWSSGQPARRPDAVPGGEGLAALDGRDHALPDDVQSLAATVLTHRLLLAPGAGVDERAAIVQDALERVPAL